MKRKIIKIDEEKCDGCGLCIPGCPEGAMQLIDGKARLISDLMCDGLGACIGDCPQGAISIEEREAEPYDEKKVMENIITQGENTIKAHIKHLEEHNEKEFLTEALQFLKDNNIELSKDEEELPMLQPKQSGCPGSRTLSFSNKTNTIEPIEGTRPSQLTQWPIQFHLISPRAPHFQNCDLLIAADCTAFSLGDFHKDYLKSKKLVIACPKLDEGQEIYLEKMKSLIDDAKINTITIMIMEVPCCSGLLNLVKRAVQQASRKVPVKGIVVGVQGQILQEDWI